MWEDVLSLGLGKCIFSSTRNFRVHNILASALGNLKLLQELLLSSLSCPGPVAKTRECRGGDHSLWYVHAWLWMPASGACIVGGTGYRHTCNGESQCRQQELGPSTGSLVAAEALAVGVHYFFLPGLSTAEDVRVYSWMD